jgi:hypothetical protein
MRVIGRYIDDQKPKDVFFFEQEGAYVLRLLMATRQGNRHQLAEFTAADLESMVRQGPALRGEQAAQQAPPPPGAGAATPPPSAPAEPPQ